MFNYIVCMCVLTSFLINLFKLHVFYFLIIDFNKKKKNCFCLCNLLLGIVSLFLFSFESVFNLLVPSNTKPN